jgi:hypothetical protein
MVCLLYTAMALWMLAGMQSAGTGAILFVFANRFPVSLKFTSAI